ncbi:MAG: DUF1587 domain-containing protein [Bradymonadaceae bacterium]
MRLTSCVVVSILAVAASGCDGYLVVEPNSGNGEHPNGTDNSERTNPWENPGRSSGSGPGAEIQEPELPPPTVPATRRLTTFEYDNALADLLGSEVRPGQALSEPTSSTYGNSPFQQRPTNNLLKAAGTIAKQAASTALADEQEARELFGCGFETDEPRRCLRVFDRQQWRGAGRDLGRGVGVL